MKSGKHEFNFDPKDQTQITAYMQLRQFTSRVTPENLIKEIKSAEASIDSAASERLAVWGVPKGNFPRGLPPKLREMEWSEGDIEDMQLLGGGRLDKDAFYIVDCSAPRTELGKRVVTLEFSTVRNTKRRKKSSSGPGPVAAAVKDDPDVSETAHAVEGNRTLLGRDLVRRASDDANGHRTLLGRDLAFAVEGKRTPLGRDLVRRASDDSNEPRESEKMKKARIQLEWMKHLKASIVEAMDAGHWVGTHVLQTDNVKYLLDELIAVLMDMKSSPS